VHRSEAPGRREAPRPSRTEPRLAGWPAQDAARPLEKAFRLCAGATSVIGFLLSVLGGRKDEGFEWSALALGMARHLPEMVDPCCTVRRATPEIVRARIYSVRMRLGRLGELLDLVGLDPQDRDHERPGA